MSDQIRDRRDAGWFWIDNDILKVHGPQIGDAGIAVYACLAMHAGNGETCFPSIKTIAEYLNRSEHYIRDALEKLKIAGLITVSPQVTEEGRQTSNLYTLLSMPTLPDRKGEGSQQEGGRVPTGKGEGSQNADELDSVNKTQDNKTQGTRTTGDDDEAEPPNPDGFDIIREYERLTGRLVSSLILKEDLEDYEREHHPEWIREAFKASADKKNPWPYAKAILDKWHREGKPVATAERKPDSTAPQEPRRYDIPEGYDGGAQSEKQTPLQSAWTEFTDAIRFMYDRQVQAAFEARIRPVTIEGGVLTITGDRAYYDYTIKALTNAAKYAGLTLEWGE